MHEGEGIFGGEDFDPPQSVRRATRLGELHVRERGRHIEGAPIAEHGHGLRQGWGGGTLALHPPGEPVRQERDGCGLDGGHRIGVGRAQELLDQQRIATGGYVHGLAHLVGGAAMERADLSDDSVSGQRVEAEAHDARLRAQLIQQLVRAAGLVRAEGRNHSDRDVRQPAGEVAEGSQRGGVAPVGVIDHEHQRPVLSGLDNEPIERMEQGRGVGDRHRLGGR